jgi:hypothetical protein
MVVGLTPAEFERYQSFLANVQAFIDGLAPQLRATGRTFFEHHVDGSFSQIAALLPNWLVDLLPVSSEVSYQLGLAQLFGWWYYCAQDALLDGEARAEVLLSAHLAFIRAIDIFRRLGLDAPACWQEFHHLTHLSAAHYALELQTRFADVSELSVDRVALIDVEFLMKRAAPVSFGVVAQAHLVGLEPETRLGQDVIAALRCLMGIRQIVDDAGDWLADLRRGRLNYVSARLLRRNFSSGLSAGGVSTDLESLVGQLVLDETFWTEIEGTTGRLGRQARKYLARYGPCRFQGIIEDQLSQLDQLWATGQANRSKLRRLFGLANPG